MQLLVEVRCEQNAVGRKTSEIKNFLNVKSISIFPFCTRLQVRTESELDIKSNPQKTEIN